MKFFLYTRFLRGGDSLTLTVPSVLVDLHPWQLTSQGVTVRVAPQLSRAALRSVQVPFDSNTT